MLGRLRSGILNGTGDVDEMQSEIGGFGCQSANHAQQNVPIDRLRLDGRHSGRLIHVINLSGNPHHILPYIRRSCWNKVNERYNYPTGLYSPAAAIARICLGLEAFEGLGVDAEKSEVALGGPAVVLDGVRNIDRCTEDCEGPADEAARNIMACIRHGGSPLCCLQCGAEADRKSTSL